MAVPTILFQNANLFSGLTGTVDRDTCTIHGVSLITSGVVAEGHDLAVDEETLMQLHSLAKARGMVPVNLDHGSGIAATCGYVNDFRLDQGKLRGDWHLLKSHNETPQMLERAEIMPNLFGLSVAFKGEGVAVRGGGPKAARAEKLLSVDCVTRPAANEGLFSAKESKHVDTIKLNMPAESQTKEPTLAEVMQRLDAMQTKQDEFNKQVWDQLQAGSSQDVNEGLSYDELNELNNATDEQLAQRGISREEVDAAVDNYNASIDGGAGAEAGEFGGERQNAEGAHGGESGEFAHAGASGNGQTSGMESTSGGYGGYAPGTVGAEFAALRQKVTTLENARKNDAIRLAAKTEAIQLQELNSKITTLAAQRDKAIELGETLLARCEALEVAVRTGTRPVTAGQDTGVRLFAAGNNGEMTEFQLDVKAKLDSGKAKTEAQAIQLSVKENPGRHADHLRTLAARSRE